mmetsp:Transcript_58330/g.96633  ORF Transcript_58330/g.96633 Transcript_58330/m.96633 type:complete len:81 (-) Transcript_58330:127-369(-)
MQFLILPFFTGGHKLCWLDPHTAQVVTKHLIDDFSERLVNFSVFEGAFIITLKGEAIFVNECLHRMAPKWRPQKLDYGIK